MDKIKPRIIIPILMVFIVASSVIINGFLENSITNAYNKQAKLELQHIKTCFNSVTGNLVEKLNKCASNALVGGRTGDVFAVNLKDMKLVWDNSLDCKTSKEMYLTKDSVCKLASNPQSCIKLAKQIKKGYNGTFKWEFDDSPEYDNWIILPDETHNFDGSSRAVAGVKDQIAVVQGFQEDEVFDKFSLMILLNKIITSILLFILSVVIMLHKKEDYAVQKSK